MYIIDFVKKLDREFGPLVDKHWASVALGVCLALIAFPVMRWGFALMAAFSQ